MLKYQITSEEFAQLEESQQGFYTQNGEVYQLAVEGIPQPDVDGLKRQRDELLAEKKAEQEKRRKAEAEAQQIEQERLAAEGNYKQLFESSQSATAEWQQKYQALQQQIEQSSINQTAIKLATDIADGPNAEILSEFVTRRLKLVDGQVRVTDASGNLTVSSVDQLKEEFKNDPRWASLVTGSKANGGGAAPLRGSPTKEYKTMTQEQRLEFEKRDPQGYQQALNSGQFGKY
ncbi:hypothetical protein SAMN05216522_1025 [Rosenbergiella nectarea]|uniref:Phage minor structural protein GP20 n=1 Tax=Rosenbergiella nectarea TaxID=988801 RepID=A0A1H9ENB9_9GAMM|nr:hypothetical protein [Rosenbergiella nectarea]SEQ27256.1 hypothetical protein SAMN05216522_1025 [Rosenbergiella nectarea]